VDKHPIDKAAEIVGSQVALADALKVTKGAVNQWKDEGRRVPAEYCPLIERMTNGAVTCEELRPDIEWQVLRIPGAVPTLPDEAPDHAPDSANDSGLSKFAASGA
jgi:DNA-binding transcriptional regulator YdaS (Cro superfamily)